MKGAVQRHTAAVGVTAVNMICPGKKNSDGAHLEGADKIVRFVREWLRLCQYTSVIEQLNFSCDFLKEYISFMGLGGKLKKFWEKTDGGDTKFSVMETTEKVGHVASAGNSVLNGVLLAKRTGIGDLGRWVTENVGVTRLFGIAGKVSVKALKKVCLAFYFSELAYRKLRRLAYKYGVLDWLKQRLPDWTGKGLIEKWSEQELNRGLLPAKKMKWKEVVWELSEYLVVLGKAAGMIGALISGGSGVAVGGGTFIAFRAMTVTVDLILVIGNLYRQALANGKPDSAVLEDEQESIAAGRIMPNGFIMV